MVLIFGIVFGVAGYLIMKSGKYKAGNSPLGNGVFSLWIMGFVSRMFLTVPSSLILLSAVMGRSMSIR